jgi:hypothetical protein
MFSSMASAIVDRAPSFLGRPSSLFSGPHFSSAISTSELQSLPGVYLGGEGTHVGFCLPLSFIQLSFFPSNFSQMISNSDLILGSISACLVFTA